MTINTARIKAICFDIDGTLNDTDGQYVDHLLPWFSPFAFLFAGRDAHKAARRFVMWLEAPGNYMLGVPDILGIDHILAGMIERVNRFSKKKMRVFQPIEGVIEMVARLADQYPLAVVSARSEETTREFLAHTGLDKYISVTVGALTVEHTKPFPDPILYAASKMGVSAEQCLMVGDTVVDIRAGRAAGAQTLGVLCGFGERWELEKANADAILETTSALEGLLKKE